MQADFAECRCQVILHKTCDYDSMQLHLQCVVSRGTQRLLTVSFDDRETGAGFLERHRPSLEYMQDYLDLREHKLMGLDGT